jgi:hypothetical protein
MFAPEQVSCRHSQRAISMLVSRARAAALLANAAHAGQMMASWLIRPAQDNRWGRPC